LQWAHHAGFALDDILLAYMNRLSDGPALTKARKREAEAI